MQEQNDMDKIFKKIDRRINQVLAEAIEECR